MKQGERVSGVGWRGGGDSDTRHRTPDACLSVAGLTVRYGATTALDGVDLDLRPDEVHAVVGENGAGKSTLVRAIAGAVAVQSGSIRRDPRVRVAWVPQETELPPDLTAGEWIFLGEELRGRFGLLDRGAMRRAAAESLRAVGSNVGPDTVARRLTAPQRKQVQLARALRGHPDVLLLDEPTAVLGDAETRLLFDSVRSERRRGAGILYVSHRLEEVLALADRVTVLRDGRKVSSAAVGEVDVETLVRRMVGRDLVRHHARRRSGKAEVALRLAGLSVAHVRDASLVVHRGEVVGLAGLVGAGRSEILEAVAFLRPLGGGSIERAAPPFLVPEDRSVKGLVRTMGLRENVFLPADAGWLRPRRERMQLAEWVRRLGIATRGSETPVDQLSGGNQQKLLLARVLRHDPRLLLLDEPTAGVDVGAKAEIHAIIRRLADSGAAILLASSDLPELLVTCDRVVCLYAGRIVGDVEAAAASEEQLAGLITGVGSRLSDAGEERGAGIRDAEPEHRPGVDP